MRYAILALLGALFFGWQEFSRQQSCRRALEYSRSVHDTVTVALAGCRVPPAAPGDFFGVAQGAQETR